MNMINRNLLYLSYIIICKYNYKFNKNNYNLLINTDFIYLKGISKM